MILEFPNLSASEENEVAAIKEMVGWDIVKETTTVSINFNDAELVNWVFEYDEDGRVTRENIRRHQELILKNTLLKEFLHFVGSSEIIDDVKTGDEPKDDVNEIYEVPELPDEDE